MLDYGATYGDAFIRFLEGFEKNPGEYIVLLVFIIVMIFMLTRFAQYLLPRDLARMMTAFVEGINDRKQVGHDEPDMLQKMEVEDDDN